jgi:hypothetical protein|tara:strand:- start:532 stop:756 length:225 start_codon:yes stop_codon:yes gene_type:complete
MTNTNESIMVESSAIYSADYDVDLQEMVVYFNNDSIYKYQSVPLFYWRGLFNSTSKGKFLNHFIFKHFQAERID